jgi:septum formation protein
VTPEVDELTDGEPEAVVVENARRKARAGLELASREEHLVLGVDTEVVLDGKLLGKAGTEEEARARLRALSGRTHEVFSGVVVWRSTLDLASPGDEKSSLGHGGSPSAPDYRPDERCGVARSRVTFRDLPDALIDAYVASGEWRDRAGAYAVQGLGSMLTERIEGDLSNVIGLPVNLVLELLPDLLDTPGDSQLQAGF